MSVIELTSLVSEWVLKVQGHREALILIKNQRVFVR